MDKLQPLIKHHYWICFVLAVIFVVVGWWTASGAIAVATDERKKSVEESFTKATQNATDPNQSWVDEATKKNAAEDTAYKAASAELWKRQQSARQWPPLLAADMKGIEFGGEIKNTTTRDKWASIYGDEIERLLEIVKPYKNGEGLVDVNSSRVTHKPYNSWRYGKPTSVEIWENQEDIWLLRSLLTSIARVNEGATRITESQIRKIFALKLRGGDREAKPGGGGAGDTSMGGMMSGDMAGDDAGYANAMMAGTGGGGGGTGSSATHPGTAFEGKSGSDILDEEFGPAGGGAAGGGGMSSMMGGPASMESGAFGSADGAGAAVEVKRYVDGGPGVELGYKTRGFVLEVLVRDDQLPNLLASLTNSDFPVEIVRVEINSASATGSPAGGNGGMTDMSGSMGMGAMGMGMGMGGGMDSLAMGGDDTGGGFSDLGGAGALSGGQGMSSGMGAGMGMPGGGMGMPGGGADVNTLAAAKGKLAYQAAMADPLIVHVKIGGLMTLYQSAQESEAQVAAEEAAATTEKAAAPPEGSGSESTDVPAEGQVDPAMTGAETPGANGAATGTAVEAASEAPAGDGAAPAVVEPAASEPTVSEPTTTESGAAVGESTTPGVTKPASADPTVPAEPGSTPSGEGTPSTPAEPVPGSEPK